MSEWSEVDEVGLPLLTYLISNNKHEEDDRIDIIQAGSSRKTHWQVILDIFLPTGFPNSVTDDYIQYQIYDSLQAFASSIAGLLSSRAVLSTLGVGDASSSATNAVIFNVLQESLGRLATIGFAYRLGTALEPECKMYRLLADVLNDFAFILDCLSPMLPRVLSMLALAVGGVLRALCGVAAGSSKASLSAHFAKSNNLGELNAKDSSQETIISLLGMLAGTFVVSYITTPVATWTALVVLLAVHLEMNRRAVRAVALRSMNRQRAGLIYHRVKRGNIPTIQDISSAEYIFQRSGVLRSAAGDVVGTCTIGCSLESFLRTSGTTTSAGAVKMSRGALNRMVRPFQDVKHLMWYNIDLASQKIDIFIALKAQAGPRDILLAWWHAIALANTMQQERTGKVAVDESSHKTVLESSLASVVKLLKDSEDQLVAAGWDLNTNAILTKPSSRISLV